MGEEINIPNNSEIDQALKEFEVKNTEQRQKELEALRSSPVPQKPKPEIKLENTLLQEEVGEIKFEADSWKKSYPSFQEDIPKMVQLLMKWSGGAIKEQKQAEYLLLGFVIVAMAISFYLFFGKQLITPKPTAESLNLIKQFAPNAK